MQKQTEVCKRLRFVFARFMRNFLLSALEKGHDLKILKQTTVSIN